MSASLDQLGWKKVIVDLRDEMPMKFSLPRVPRLGKQWSFDDSNGCDDREEINPSQSKVLESRDVANAYSTPDDFLAFPLGHNTMVAVAQSRFTFVFKGGRPLMDKLALEMIDEILNFEL